MVLATVRCRITKENSEKMVPRSTNRLFVNPRHVSMLECTRSSTDRQRHTERTRNDISSDKRTKLAWQLWIRPLDPTSGSHRFHYHMRCISQAAMALTTPLASNLHTFDVETSPSSCGKHQPRGGPAAVLLQTSSVRSHVTKCAKCKV